MNVRVACIFLKDTSAVMMDISLIMVTQAFRSVATLKGFLYSATFSLLIYNGLSSTMHK